MQLSFCLPQQRVIKVTHIARTAQALIAKQKHRRRGAR
jgi:hypothetical protein